MKIIVKDCALEAGTTVTGGQTVMNPWCTIGGVATTICQPNEFIIPDSAVVGDVLVLTKPLGTQVCYQGSFICPFKKFYLFVAKFFH